MIREGEKRRIVVIGGSGFIGSNLLFSLLRKKEYDLISISRKKYDLTGVKCLQGDFGDATFLNNILKKDDIVVHLACSTVPATSEIDKENDYKQNVLGTKTVLNVGAKRGIEKIIFMSSGGTVYGNHGQRAVLEDYETNPIGYHGKMKLEIENLIKDAKINQGLDYLILRASNPYGRLLAQRKDNQGVVEAFLFNAMNNKLIEVWGDGNVIRDFIYIEDFISALGRIIESGIKNDVLNIGSGIGKSVNEVLEIIKTVINRDIAVRYIQSRPYDVPYNVLDIEKLKKSINWEPKTALSEGIDRLYAEYRI